MTARNDRLHAAAGLLAALLVLASCSSAAATPPGRANTGSDPIPVYVAPSPTIPSWFDVEMVDVNSGKSFKVSDFAGKVVLVETMATWCPTCQGEMSQVQQLHTDYGPGTDLVTISLDVDPNEDATVLKKYSAQNGFDWLIAVAPTSVGGFLAKNYDVDYLNPPLQPMLIVDRKGGVWGLPFGVKSAISLKQTLDQYLAP